MPILQRLLVVASMLVSFGVALPAAAQDRPTLHVSAAISLKQAMETIATEYEKRTGVQIELAFGSSGQLASNIERGAEVDLFVSAAQANVDKLIAAKSARADDVRIVATNRLVLIVPIDSTTVKSFADLALPGVRRIAAGEPRAVPAGAYAKQTLTHLKLFETVKDKLVFGANVRQVLDYVSRGEVDAGLVYHTDAMLAVDKVKTVATAEADWHDAITYPAVVIAATKQHAAAAKFIVFLQTEAAQAELKRLGFGPPSQTPQPATRPAAMRPVVETPRG